MRPIVIAAAACVFAILSSVVAAAADGKLNVVVFLADDLGIHDLGYTGSTFYESPNIDALSKRGCVFTSAYANCPVCSPTRAAIMTGKYPQRVGITDYIGGPQPEEARTQEKYRDRLLPAPYKERLALEERTIGEAFHDAGYATFFAGKWHLGGKGFTPDQQGFDVSLGAGHQGSPGKNGYFSPYNVPLSPGPKGEHLDKRLASEAAKWIAQQSREKPFFLYMSFYDVHIPLMAPDETVKYFENKRAKMNLDDQFAPLGAGKVRTIQSHATYAAMIKTMDDCVGTIVKQLEDQKLMDDTIIVFTSDNGGLSTAEGSPTSNSPQRGGKGWAYEGGTRVPMFIIVPGVTKAGSSSTDRAISMDLYPTLAAACRLRLRDENKIDGVDLAPALKGESLAPRPLFWHYPHYGNQGGAPFSSIVDGNWKLIVFHDPRQGVGLYDLAADPSEEHNVASSNKEKVDALTKKLDAWKKDVGAIDASPQHQLR